MKSGWIIETGKKREYVMTSYDKALILVLIVAAVFGLYYTAAHRVSDADSYGAVFVNGKEHSRIELTDKGPAQEFTITTPWGYNTVEVGNNRIRIKEASCPDQICVKEGWIEKAGEMIVCMPNRVYIKIVAKEREIDDIAY